MGEPPIRFLPSDYPGGRILLMCGEVQAGAVFPPAGDTPGKHPWVWRFWIGGYPTKEGRGGTEQTAKNALVETLHDWLRLASLQVKP